MLLPEAVVLLHCAPLAGRIAALPLLPPLRQTLTAAPMSSAPLGARIRGAARGLAAAVRPREHARPP